MQIPDKEKEYEESLKSIETENYLDQWFYRPIGFRIAKMLCNTGITPNMVTIISIFVGSVAGWLFYNTDNYLIFTGIACLVFANILDCVDGQLARLTGIHSKVGRLLDGFAGNIWFTLIYVGLALRLKNEYGTGLFFIPAVVSGLSHLLQANVTDYYKTLHLYFVSKEKGKEFQSIDDVRLQYRNMQLGVDKIMFFFYMGYTLLQESITPKIQLMLKDLHTKYGDDIPDAIRLNFRRKSERFMKRRIDFLTFNGRTIPLFLIVFTDCVWLYFVFEIVVLNAILVISIREHEKICASTIEYATEYEKDGIRH